MAIIIIPSNDLLFCGYEKIIALALEVQTEARLCFSPLIAGAFWDLKIIKYVENSMALRVSSEYNTS